jgi:hypothetical protein
MPKTIVGACLSQSALALMLLVACGREGSIITRIPPFQIPDAQGNLFPPTLSMHCVWDAGELGQESDSDTVTVNTVYACNYWRGERRLHVELRKTPPSNAPDYNDVEVWLSSFTGPGAYTTTYYGEVNEETDVAIRGAKSGQNNILGGTSNGVDKEYHECTIAVTSTNLHSIDIPAGTLQKGFVEMTVTCGAVSSYPGSVCTVSPATWLTRIASCEAVN